ncbi:MAG: BtpA/SgcQ family protein [Halobacteriota archaeon]
MNLDAVYGTNKPIIGMVHLDPLPGAPKADAPIERVVDRARRDATRLERGGVDGVLVENFGDAPFYPDDVPKHTVASMTRAVLAVSESTDLPVGINVLRNDAIAAVSIATAVDAEFVRVNVHTGARVTDQGVVQGVAHETMRLRERLGASVSVFADVDVKHSTPLGPPVEASESIRDQINRGLADAVIISGRATGRSVDVGHLEGVVESRPASDSETPIFVGSGVDADSIPDLLAIADGAIVGTSLKVDGETTAPVSIDRVKAVMDRAETVR